MNPNEKNITDLINEIEPLNQYTAQRLRDLSQPLEEMEEKTAIAWAEADIYRLINPNLLVEQYRQSLSVNQGLTWIQALRNIFILLPVMVTWGGIAWAVSGYHALLQEAPDLASQPFLLLWQGGFQGQMWLTFEILGYIDFGLLLIVVILTLVDQISLLFSRSDQTEAQVRDFRAELNHFLAERSWKLNQHKQDILLSRQPLAQLVEQFSGLLRSIEAEYERMRELASKKSREIDDFRIFTKALGNGATEMTSAISALQRVHQELSQSIQAFPNLLLEVKSKQSEIVISLDQGKNEVERLIEVQRHLSSQWDQISETGNTSNQRLEQIIEVQRNWGQSLVEVRNNWQQSLVEQKKWEQSLVQVQENWGQNLVQVQNKWGEGLIEFQKNARQDLREMVDELRQTTKQVASAIEKFSQTNGTLGQFQNSLKEIEDEQREVVQQVSQTSAGFEQFGQQFNESLTTLNQTLVHLYTQSNSTPVQAESDLAAEAKEAEQYAYHPPTQIAEAKVQPKNDSADKGKEQEPRVFHPPTEAA